MSSKHPIIHLGTDHAGLPLKNEIKTYLIKLGYHVKDVGAYEDNAKDDYPDFIIPAVEGAVRGRGLAIVFGGSGLGECIAANKVKGARCVVAFDTYTATMSREHNNANVLSLGSRTVTKDYKLAKRIVKKWLETPFSGDTRHKRRLTKISKYER